MRPAAWSGWPDDDWFTPQWNSSYQTLTDTAWCCLDLNASILSTMPPYLVGAAPTLSSDWTTNPDPDRYTGWIEFAKQLFWDYHLGEAFVIATAYYATGWPARFHVVPPYLMSVDWGPNGTRRYSIGGLDVTADVLHVRYQSHIGNLHGSGPLQAMGCRLVAAGVFAKYATNIASRGGIPTGILEHPEELTAEQSAALQAQWVNARMNALGEPAVVSGGAKFTVPQINPRDMALHELATFNESRIAVALGVPPFLVGLPSGGDPMTYKNMTSLFDYHWRASLRPKAATVMEALSGWALPRGTLVELNRDAYVEPEPKERAETAQILNSIRDDNGTPVLSVQQIQQAERLSNTTPSDDLAGGVLK
jgi:HK97 family phage portal protein